VARSYLLASLAAATFVAPARAQDPVRPASTATQQAAVMDSRLRTEIALLSRLLGNVDVPSAELFELGNREVATRTERQGTVAVARGDLSVRGHIAGDALAVHGDIIVYPGGSISGNAVAVDGRVRTLGGIVEGDIRSIRGITGGILARAAGRTSSDDGPVSTWAAIKMVLGWFAVLCAIGIGVLLFAEKNLDGVVTALELHFTRSFWTGVLAQVAAIPALLLVMLGLAITLIGILLIPFAVVAYVVALAGLLTLGFLAVARFTGRVFFRGASESRATSLRSLFVGLVIYLGLWLLAAAFSWNPIVGSVLRAVALAGSWVALTFGAGAAILARAGTRREGAARRPRPIDDLSWQTPTPVTGVVAARRPVAAVKES
jgi:hypothetical protein